MAKCLFMCSLATWVPSVEKYLFRVHAHFLIWSSWSLLKQQLPSYNHGLKSGLEALWACQRNSSSVSSVCLSDMFMDAWRSEGWGKQLWQKENQEISQIPTKNISTLLPFSPQHLPTAPSPLTLSSSDYLSFSYLVHKQDTGPVSDLYICRPYYLFSLWWCQTRPSLPRSEMLFYLEEGVDTALSVGLSLIHDHLDPWPLVMCEVEGMQRCYF